MVMNVCKNCFHDKELIGLILSSKNIGTCKVCNSNNVNLLDVSELLDFFQELIDNFQTIDKGVSLKSKIQEKWNFFSSLETASKILDEILPKLSTRISSTIDSVEYIDDIVDNFTYWEKLKEDLKWSNRFLSDIEFLEELGWDGFFNTQFEYSIMAMISPGLTTCSSETFN